MDDIEQADRREQLVAAIGRLPLDQLETRESLGVCTAYFDKQKSSIDILRADLEAEKAAYKSHRSPTPPKPCREQ